MYLSYIYVACLLCHLLYYIPVCSVTFSPTYCLSCSHMLFLPSFLLYNACYAGLFYAAFSAFCYRRATDVTPHANLFSLILSPSYHTWRRYHAATISLATRTRLIPPLIFAPPLTTYIHNATLNGTRGFSVVLRALVLCSPCRLHRRRLLLPPTSRVLYLQPDNGVAGCDVWRSVG